MLDFNKFRVLTFDCYGTLVDWEAGILSVLGPLLSARGVSASDAEIVELYGDFEAKAESGEYHTYRDVLASVVRAFGNHFSFSPSEAEAASLASSIPQWRPWPDTVRALKALGARYQLAIVSNIDDALFSTTRPHLGVEFQSVTTAEQARCYKPCLEIFKLAMGKTDAGVRSILHVGQSIYHDVLPAQSLGIATVWVNRPSPRAGVGAVRKAEGKPDLVVPDLKTLADLATGQ